MGIGSAKFCEIFSHSVRYGMYVILLSLYNLCILFSIYHGLDSYCEPLCFRVYFISRFCDLKLFSRKFKFAVHDVFLFILYMQTFRENVEFANISENKVLEDNSELTVVKQLALTPKIVL